MTKSSLAFDLFAGDLILDRGDGSGNFTHLILENVTVRHNGTYGWVSDTGVRRWTFFSSESTQSYIDRSRMFFGEEDVLVREGVPHLSFKDPI